VFYAWQIVGVANRVVDYKERAKELCLLTSGLSGPAVSHLVGGRKLGKSTDS
jgi:hypothetical protein